MKKSHLTLEQRYEIQAYRDADKKPSEISAVIGRDKPVISRELNRNSKPNGQYRAIYAHGIAQIRKERLKRPRKLDHAMETAIHRRLREDQWSPEQIKGRADREGKPMVSHERIHQLIRKDKADGGDLYKHTRHCLKHRKRPVGGSHGGIRNKRSIDDRPDIVSRKARMGDWEIDTIIGPQNRGAIVTIVERQTGLLFMRKLPDGKHAKELGKIVVDILIPYKDHVHTITSDNGSEFADHSHIAKKLGAGFFFAHPYSSWERGINEYTNKLIRQYIPKKQSFEELNNQYIKEIQYKINARPRKKLDYDNPKQIFYTNLDKKVALVS
ncbi:IS30 family transposase [Parapedobacter tibetensis]|uniref:IS30 family transposase n=1 Tax=Parapedobacter tibetensis TaxID=2972951 RepID=UPI00214D6C03|nr:IS30 family transposase [Parapedobacter tibetensis]